MLEKSIFRIQSRFDLLERTVTDSQFDTPSYDAVLVLISDDKPPGYYRRVKNSDRFFQVIAGIAPDLPDERLLEDVFDIIRRAVLDCPDLKARKNECEAFFDNIRPSIVGKAG